MVVQRRLTDYLGRREDIVDVLGIGKTRFSKVLELGGGFRVVYLEEPELDFGGGYVDVHFPRDFVLVKRFYSSSKQEINAEAVFYTISRGRVNFVSDLQELVKPKSRHGKSQDLESRTRFKLVLTPGYNVRYEDVIESIKRAGNDRGRNLVIGVIARGLSDHQFAYLKALSVLHEVPTHVVNLDRVEEIADECSRNGYQSRIECPGYRAYMLNNYVQLYAKAGGIPWTVSPSYAELLKNVAIVGIATSKFGEGYFVGVAYAVAYFGNEVRSFVSADTFSENLLDIYDYRSRGLYIPKKVVENLMKAIDSDVRCYNVNTMVIFQTPMVHEQEVEGLRVALGDRWILVHVKGSGFAKRVYDMSTDDGGLYRGLCLVDRDSMERFSSTGVVRGLIATTGKTLMLEYDKRRHGFVQVLKNTYKPGSTPKPLEIEVVVDTDIAKDARDDEALYLVAYIGELILLLSKLDWESYTNWPKIPFVVKYARRVAKILARLYESKDGGHATIAEALVDSFKRVGPRLLRYIM